jgi:hypothetical protein
MRSEVGEFRRRIKISRTQSAPQEEFITRLQQKFFSVRQYQQARFFILKKRGKCAKTTVFPVPVGSDTMTRRLPLL